jgi:hypothetical protein
VSEVAQAVEKAVSLIHPTIQVTAALQRGGGTHYGGRAGSVKGMLREIVRGSGKGRGAEMTGSSKK